jgi:hypothetical protein
MTTPTPAPTPSTPAAGPSIDKRLKRAFCRLGLKPKGGILGNLTGECCALGALYLDAQAGAGLPADERDACRARALQTLKDHLGTGYERQAAFVAAATDLSYAYALGLARGWDDGKLFEAEFERRRANRAGAWTAEQLRGYVDGRRAWQACGGDGPGPAEDDAP